MYDKPFKTYNEQINILKNRGIIINDIEKAKMLLSSSTYYELINGYQDWFTYEKDKFKSGITLEFLNSFYYFDHGFQNILFLNSVYIETAFKSCLSYIIAKKYGVHQDIYLQRKNFRNMKYKNEIINFYSLINKIKNVYEKQSQGFEVDEPTKTYLNNKNHIPPWILFKNITFSNAIQLYSFLKRTDKLEIIKLMIPDIYKKINLKNSKDIKHLLKLFSNSLTIVRKYRNTIAHNLKFIAYRPKNYNIEKNILKDTKYYILFEKDKNDYNNCYAMIISILILTKDIYLQNELLENIIFYLQNQRTIELAKKYCEIIDFPYSIITLLKEYIKQY